MSANCGCYGRRAVPRLSRGKQALVRLSQTTDGQATSIADLQGRIISIRQVMASGVESAAYGDKRTEFRSLEELREILSALEEELADLLGIGGRIRQIRITTAADKGL